MRRPNRLINEKSPYLRQHAYNPVDWYPWGREAFERARKEGKPIFLSIGYSACHWCHVMEKESFEDPEVASILNQFFVCVKVDREERPDVDQFYMAYCQSLTGGGGWPLNVFMTPDGKPFFATTYLPKESVMGRMGFKELLLRIKDVWLSNRGSIEADSERVVNSLRAAWSTTSSGDVGSHLVDDCYKHLLLSFDEEYGGFGGAPKFPTPSRLMFLLRYWRWTGVGKAVEMVKRTLDYMHLGGIYDHLGGGFHRYSTDRRWVLPHFEKMLYDQAMISLAYTEAFQATRSETYSTVARETLDFVLRELKSPEGLFYSSMDADVDGVEGGYYLWTLEDFKRALGADFEIAARIFNVRRDGNYLDEASKQLTGRNVLYIGRPLNVVAEELRLGLDDLTRVINKIRRVLFEERKRRRRPAVDDKVLTDWNSMMVVALARAYQAFKEPRYLEAAEKAASALLRTMASRDGGLYHRYKDSEASIPGFLDDYAYLTWGLLELYEAVFKTRYLEDSIHLVREAVKRFWDDGVKSFWIVDKGFNELPSNIREAYDGAYPSGNSVMAYCMHRLFRITGGREYEEKTRLVIRSFSADIKAYPASYSFMLIVLGELVRDFSEVVIVGRFNDSARLAQLINSRFVPNKVLLVVPTDRQVERARLSRISPFVGGMKSAGDPVIYLCRNFACDKPTKDINEVVKRLTHAGG